MLLPNGKATLVDTSQAECFNLSVLKRMDEDILEILYSATHVAVYEFDTGRKSWKRSDIEGTLFLVKRCSAPRFRMIVVNGKRIDNFTEEVDGSLECEVLQAFLLYTKGNNQLYGIWFYDEKNCEEFGNFLKKIVKGMPKTSPTNTPRASNGTTSIAGATATLTTTSSGGTGIAGGGGVSNSDFKSEIQTIFSQLNAQTNMNSTSMMTTTTSTSTTNVSVPNKSTVIGGSSLLGSTVPISTTTTSAMTTSAPSAATIATSTGESEHLMRLFLQAKERGGAPSSSITGPPPPPPPPSNTLAISAPMMVPDSQNTTTATDVVLSLDPGNVAAAASSSSGQQETMMKGIVDPGSSTALTAVPLPPDFFKPSNRTPGIVNVEETVPTFGQQQQIVGGATAAPDPLNLPMPDAVNGRGINLGLSLTATTTAPTLGTNLIEEENVISSSLARFFAKTEEENNAVLIDGGLRDRFRQALTNLLNNDDVLDSLITEFKKVGITPIQ